MRPAWALLSALALLVSADASAQTRRPQSQPTPSRFTTEKFGDWTLISSGDAASKECVASAASGTDWRLAIRASGAAFSFIEASLVNRKFRTPVVPRLARGAMTIGDRTIRMEMEAYDDSHSIGLPGSTNKFIVVDPRELLEVVDAGPIADSIRLVIPGIVDISFPVNGANEAIKRAFACSPNFSRRDRQ